MLKKLHIKNYALIEQLDIAFSKKMTIITGETGAGKSIILGALSLILGKRADTHVLFDKKKKSVVEGTFDIRAYYLQDFFEEAELDYDANTIIRREITPSGKSRAFVNDTPVRLTLLRQLGERLISLHAQHQTLDLYDASYHLFIIDTLAKHTDLLEIYRQQYKTYHKSCQTLKQLKAQQAQLQKDIDYIQFQLKEFDEINLEKLDEQEQLELELSQLENAENILQALQESRYLIDENEPSILSQLNHIKGTISSLTCYGSDYEAAFNRLDSIYIELQDINNEINSLEEVVAIEPERLEQVNERLTLIYRLQKKHGVQTVAELMEIHTQLRTQNYSADNIEAEISVLQKEIEKQQAALLENAQQISANRKKQIPIFEQHINQMLTNVGMLNARVKARQRLLLVEKFTTSGMDEVSILFAPNKGSRFNELKKVASGGELSRLMLCIQSLIAENTALPTLIFDEIDTGISGEVALKVGAVMQQLAQSHQVMCITHLPQIASRGDTHFFVYKDETQERTISRIRQLKTKERIVEIAKMLSGAQPGRMALANARELLKAF